MAAVGSVAMQDSSQKERAISQDNAYYSVLTSLFLACILLQKFSSIHYKHYDITFMVY
jgi:hypothetical protein